MKYIFENNTVSFEILDSFDIEQTFSCGQCFRWDKNSDGSFSAVVGSSYITVCKENNILKIKNTSEYDFIHQWIRYFDLDRNYDEIRKFLCQKYEKLKKTAACTAGIRILSQDPWEALCSFIISQNNNIPRIKGIIDRLCRQFGNHFEDFYTFPSADTLAICKIEDLAPLRAGFRAKYIIDAAQKVSRNQINLEQLRTADLQTARSELMTIKGVGSKVADCTLLYGLHRLEAFPVDVWIKRAIETEFSDIKIEDLGDYAGIAQQYIFHYMRQLT